MYILEAGFTCCWLATRCADDGYQHPGNHGWGFGDQCTPGIGRTTFRQADSDDEDGECVGFRLIFY